jgi:hypothetical protein
MTDRETQAALRKLAAEYIVRATVIETQEAGTGPLSPSPSVHGPA